MSDVLVHKIRPGGVPDRALDLLQIDGGWLTGDYLADRLGVGSGTLRRALYRLREYGCVENRTVDLAFAGRRGRAGTWYGRTFDCRLEWRASVPPAHWAA